MVDKKQFDKIMKYIHSKKHWVKQDIDETKEPHTTYVYINQKDNEMVKVHQGKMIYWYEKITTKE